MDNKFKFGEMSHQLLSELFAGAAATTLARILSHPWADKDYASNEYAYTPSEVASMFEDALRLMLLPPKRNP